jgi:hypothetical protein
MPPPLVFWRGGRLCDSRMSCRSHSTISLDRTQIRAVSSIRRYWRIAAFGRGYLRILGDYIFETCAD